MIVRFDLSHFRVKAREMGIFANDQLPFAIANTLNSAMLGPGGARDHIVNRTFPASFDVHNRSFARAAFVVRKASKAQLSVELFDRLKRGHLAKHAMGGTKGASGHLAIPNWGVGERVKRTAAGAKPRPRQLRVPGKALRVVRGKGIFEGRGGHLHALYWFSTSAKLEKRFPFYEEFAIVSKARVDALFPGHIQRAVNSSFSR